VARPLAAREQGGIRQPAEQPDRGRARRRRLARPREERRRLHPAVGRRRHDLRRVEPHPRPSALARLEVAVRGQVGVGRDDDAARDAELGREHARRRQRRSGHQPAVLDRAPQSVLEPFAQPATVGGPEVHQHVAGEAVLADIGLFTHRRIGR
jgi:hypothetical protein